MKRVMANTPLLAPNALAHYGRTLTTYRGEGKLRLSSGARLPGEFEAGQLETGETLLLFATTSHSWDLAFSPVTGTLPVSFEGRTDWGGHIVTVGNLAETNFLPDASQEGTYSAIRVRHLTFTAANPSKPRRLKFLLCNLDGLTGPASLSVDGIRFTLQGTSDSDDSLKRLRTTKGVIPTAELATTSQRPPGRVKAAADELCYLLSIALGTKVQWISLREETLAARLIRMHHYSRVTKRFGSLCAIDIRGDGLREFLRKSAKGQFTLARRSSGLTDSVIDAYLDAKQEGDFLQVRALKLVIAVEMLRSEYLKSSGTSAHIFAPDEFDRCIRSLKKALKPVVSASFQDSSKVERALLYANVRGLNRAPFGRHMEEICRVILMPLKHQELARFVASRNHLVHEGRFYCERASREERRKLEPLESEAHEWFWLVHFVDRMFLRAVGYEGPYLDWSTPSNPRKGVLEKR